jgi:hypothetical protein
MIRAGALDDDDHAERLEHEADLQYADIIPADDTLFPAFHRRLSEEPAAFAGTQLTALSTRMSGN